jgi:hypothetical protein
VLNKVDPGWSELRYTVNNKKYFIISKKNFFSFFSMFAQRELHFSKLALLQQVKILLTPQFSKKKVDFWQQNSDKTINAVTKRILPFFFAEFKFSCNFFRIKFFLYSHFSSKSEQEHTITKENFV